MNVNSEIGLLKARAKEIGARLDLLNRRVNGFRQTPGISNNTAFIDSGRCVGCGICETVCPVSAIVIKSNVAAVNEFRCIGCGRCVDECPQGAITLRSLVFERENIRRQRSRNARVGTRL